MRITTIMTIQGQAELIEVTSIQADVELGVRERKYAYKSRGRATAIVELTICAERDDDCSAVRYVVRYHVNPGNGWHPARKSREAFDTQAMAVASADATWKILLSWIRAITPVVPRRVEAAEDCSCHD